MSVTHKDRKPSACHDQAEEGKSQQEHQLGLRLAKCLKRENGGEVFWDTATGPASETGPEKNQCMPSWIN